MTGHGQLTEQVDTLTKVLCTRLRTDGETRLSDCQSACTPILHWLTYLRSSELTGCCDEMLASLQGCAVETAGMVAMGLVRPAIFSLRAQIDSAVGWLFYKDHPMEWTNVVSTGEGFLLKGAVFEHFAVYRKNFLMRMNLLEKHKSRSVTDPYRLLSAHVHGQSSLVLPRFNGLEDLVYESALCEQSILLQQEVAEYISDMFVSYFGDKWASLPEVIVRSVKARVPQERQPELFG